MKNLNKGLEEKFDENWKSKGELISEVLLWTHTHGYLSADRPVKTYIHQFGVDNPSGQEDLPGVMDNREGQWERIKGYHAICTTSVYIYIYIYIGGSLYSPPPFLPRIGGTLGRKLARQPTEY